MFVPVPPEIIALNRPLPVNLWNAKGVLLLPRGDVVVSETMRQKLMLHEPMVKLNEYRSAASSWGQSGSGLERAQLDAQSNGSDEEAAALSNLNAYDFWFDLQAKLALLLRQNVDTEDFGPRLETMARQAFRVQAALPDDSLFVLVQLLFDRQISYSASHALLSAVTCQMVGPLAGISPDEQVSLFHAALTMNIGMSRLQDQLAQQKQPPDDNQRQSIRAHPEHGVDLLRQLGVQDPVWLQLVLDHHESPDGTGYPGGKTELGLAQQLLHMSDLFTARISPRRSRRGLLPHTAVRNIYLESQQQSNALGSVFVKLMGMYPPGSYVKLHNNETAVVVRRGRRANAPLVLSIASSSGMPLGIPSLRDTELPPYAIKDSVAADEVKIRLDMSRLFTRG